MGRSRGGGACGGVCAVLTAALVVFALVIRGGGGPKQSHAPAFARKVLLSIRSGHPQQLRAPRFRSIDAAVPPSKQAVLPTMQPSPPPNHFYQLSNTDIPPSVQSPGQPVPPSQMISPFIQTGNHRRQEQVPAASPSLPVQPHVPHPKLGLNTPAAAPFLEHPPWSFQPLPSPPSTGSQSTQPAPSLRINSHSAPPSYHTPPTGQDTFRVPVASPPAEPPIKRKPLPKAVPPRPITPSSSQDKDDISVARSPNNLPRHSSSPPKGSVSLIQCKKSLAFLKELFAWE